MSLDTYQQLVDMEAQLSREIYDYSVHHTRVILEEVDRPNDYELFNAQICIMLEYQKILNKRIACKEQRD